jgi:hypothetical protein
VVLQDVDREPAGAAFLLTVNRVAKMIEAEGDTLDEKKKSVYQLSAEATSSFRARCRCFWAYIAWYSRRGRTEATGLHEGQVTTGPSR